jgi:hypothetical protein
VLGLILVPGLSLGPGINIGAFMFWAELLIKARAGIFNSEGWHIMSEVKGPNL